MYLARGNHSLYSRATKRVGTCGYVNDLLCNCKLSKGLYLMIRALIFSALCQLLIMNLILDSS